MNKDSRKKAFLLSCKPMLVVELTKIFPDHLLVDDHQMPIEFPEKPARPFTMWDRVATKN